MDLFITAYFTVGAFLGVLAVYAILRDITWKIHPLDLVSAILLGTVLFIAWLPFLLSIFTDALATRLEQKSEPVGLE